MDNYTRNGLVSLVYLLSGQGERERERETASDHNYKVAPDLVNVTQCSLSVPGDSRGKHGKYDEF